MAHVRLRGLSIIIQSLTENKLTIFFRKYSNSFFTPFPHVLHYAPTDGSKNGETVFSVLHQRPGETWQLPDSEDPMSVTDVVSMHPAT